MCNQCDPDVRYKSVFFFSRSVSRRNFISITDLRSSLRAPRASAIETESEPKESTVSRIAHRSPRSLLLSASSLSHSLSLPPAATVTEVPFSSLRGIGILSLSLSIKRSIYSSIFLPPVSLSLSHPYIGHLALGEYDKSCRWTPRNVVHLYEGRERGSGTHASIHEHPPVNNTHHTFHSASYRHGMRV